MRGKANTVTSARVLCICIAAMFIFYHMACFGYKEVYSAQSMDAGPGKKLTPKEPLNPSFQGYDMIYLIDNSGSVWGQQEKRDQAFRNITNLAIGSDFRIGAYYFTDCVYQKKQKDFVSVNRKEESQDLLNFLHMNKQDEDNKNTNIGVALKTAADQFENSSVSREKIVILFSDGYNDKTPNNQTYEDEADKEMEKQAKRLKKLGVKIYCIYIKKGESKSENLKKLVNYYSDNNFYTEERFLEIDGQEIDQLSDDFAKVFYRAQNNMKYRKIAVDSFGSETFYVPSIGIENVRIFLDANVQAQLYCDDSQVNAKIWKDTKGKEATATFIKCENPQNGTYKLRVSEMKNQVKGTIAYYPNLKAAAELVPVKETLDQVIKGQQVQLFIYFYDKNDRQIQIDQVAEVETEVTVNGESGNGRVYKVKATIDSGIAKSEPFVIDTYGTCRCDMHLYYKDFVDLDYSLACGAVERTAPVVHSIKNEVFRGSESKDGKIHFSIEEKRLFEDLEGETIKVKKVVSADKENKITAKQRDGYLDIKAQKAGDIKFTIQLADASGMVAETVVQGVLENKAIGKIRNIVYQLIPVVALVPILMFFDQWWQKGKKGKYIQKFAKTKEMFDEERTKSNRIIDGIFELGNIIDDALHAEDEDGGKAIGILKLAQSLTKEQQEDFKIIKYLEKSYESDIGEDVKKTAEIKNGIKEMDKSVDIYAQQVDNEKNKQKHLHRVNRTLKEACTQMEKELDNLKRNDGTLEEEAEKLFGEIQEIGDAAGKIHQMLHSDIRCSLVISDITGLPDVSGKKVCWDWGEDMIQGYYKLDDVKLFGYGTLSDEIRTSTGIYVYGCEEGREAGLKLRSARPFSCLQLPQDMDTEPVWIQSAVLMGGQQYRLNIMQGSGAISMVVSVEL